MMGRTHAASGLVVASLVATATNATPQDALMLLIGIPGFALLPDIDHPSSLAGRSLGKLSGIPGRVLRHRRETHSLLGVATFASVTSLAVLLKGHWASTAWLFFLVAVSALALLRAFRLSNKRSIWSPLLALTASMAVALDPNWTLPVAVATGMLIHIAGDVITRGGCPLLWPWTNRRFAFNWFKTNSPVEHVLFFVFLIASFFLTGSWAMVAYATYGG